MKTTTKTLRKRGGESSSGNSRVITPLKILEVVETEPSEYIAVKAEDYGFAEDFIFGGKTSKDFENDPTMESLSLSFEKRHWNRLEKQIRIKKLNEWIDEQLKLNLSLDETKNKSLETLFGNLREELIQRTNSGEFYKDKSIIYDIEERKITSIPSIIFDFESMTYRIDLSRKR